MWGGQAEPAEKNLRWLSIHIPGWGAVQMRDIRPGFRALVFLLQQVHKFIQLLLIHAPAIVRRRIDPILDLLVKGGGALDAAADYIRIGLRVLGHGLGRNEAEKVKNNHLGPVRGAAGRTDSREVTTPMEAAISKKQAEQSYQLLLRCGAQRAPSDFCSQLVKELANLLAYDQARALFLDRSGKICGSRLFGVNERHWRDFMYYYDNDLVFSRYSLKEPMRLSQKDKVYAQNYWYDLDEKTEDNSAFVDDYVRSLRLYHSMGIGLSDQENCIRSIIVLDRMQDIPFSHQELELVKLLQPLLENYHIDLLLEAEAASSPLQVLKQTYFLTKREAEIVELLMDGLTPALIGKRVSISVATVYRHIANIYQKCHISNRQELHRLFSGQKPQGIE